MKRSKLKINPDNPFPAKSDADVIDLSEKIKRDPEFLSPRPIVYDSSNKNLVLGGNKRLAALDLLKYDDIPDKWLFDAKDWDAEKKRRFIFADNYNIGSWKVDFTTSEEIEEWNIKFDVEEPNEPKKKSKSLSIVLTFKDESQHDLVKAALSQISDDPADAVVSLVGNI